MADATILIVDDLPENIEMLSAALKDHYRIKFALDGENALRIARGDNKPDLILLDVVMPGLDGYAVCQALKADAETRDIPVIFVSARDEVEEEQRGLEAGAVDYVTKPISHPIVLARVRAHLALKREADERKRTQARLHQALTELELILEHASLGITRVVRSPAGRVMRLVNRGLEQILGYAHGELEGRDTRAIAPNDEEYDAFHRIYDEILVHGDVHRCEQALRRKDGRIILTQMVGIAIDPKDMTKGVIWLIEDITERRAAEDRLRTSNTELSAALDTLSLAHDELLRSEKLASLGALVAGVTHELNTPIGNALIIASTMQEQAVEVGHALSTAIKRSTLERYLRETQGAADIVTRNLRKAADLLQSFKQVAADQTSSQRRTFSLAELVDEIVLTLRPTFKKTPYRVECDIDPELQMDSFPGPLGQVLTNLVTNALMHAFEGLPQGSLRLVGRRLDRAMCELIAADDGKGIQPENLERIFDPFFTTRLGRGGSGLGLNIVRSLVTGTLGGTIAVASQPGQGTTFTLSLPLVAPPAPAAREKPRTIVAP